MQQNSQLKHKILAKLANNIDNIFAIEANLPKQGFTKLKSNRTQGLDLGCSNWVAHSSEEKNKFPILDVRLSYDGYEVDFPEAIKDMLYRNNKDIMENLLYFSTYNKHNRFLSILTINKIIDAKIKILFENKVI